MAISYLTEKWEEITRDERYFCAELFYEIKKDLIGKKRFLRFLKEKDKKRRIEASVSEKWDIGYEVCFYRDFLRHNGISREKTKAFSPKRTFDLVLFAESAFIIIEAKAFEGFDNEQLNSFDKDKRDVNKAIGLVHKGRIPKVYVLALTSADYKMKAETKAHFDLTITWNDLWEVYRNPIFKTADSLKSGKECK